MANGSLSKTQFLLTDRLIVHNRQVYGILDFIGDIGGLFEGLKYIVFITLSVLNFFIYNPITIHMVRQIFWLRTSVVADQSGQRTGTNIGTVSKLSPVSCLKQCKS